MLTRARPFNERYTFDASVESSYTGERSRLVFSEDVR